MLLAEMTQASLRRINAIAHKSLHRRLQRLDVQSPLEFARKCTVPDGRNRNSHYDPDSHQVQKAILEEVGRRITKLTIVKPVQDGGSLVAQIILFWCVIAKKQAVIIAYPTQESAGDIWLTKVRPMMVALGMEPERGQGSDGGVGRVMQFPGGGAILLRTAGGRGEAQSASVTGDAALLDEADDWPSLDRLRAMSRRVEEMDDSLIIENSTVKRTEGSIVMAEYEAGSQGRMWYACPHCGEYQKLEWEMLKWEEKDGHLVEDSEYITCTKTGCVMRGDDRRVLLLTGKMVHAGQMIAKDGTITGERKSPLHTSILWWRGESPRRTLPSLIESFIEARAMVEQTGDHGPMKRFHHDYLCRPYDGDKQELNTNGPLTPNILVAISARSTLAAVEYKSDIIEQGASLGGTFAYRSILNIPDEVEACFGGVDVQDNRVYWVHTGANARAQEFELGWGQEWARHDQKVASDDELYLLLDRVAARLRALSGELPFTVGAIDCAHRTDLVLRWCGANRQNWRPVRGSGGNQIKDAQPGDIAGISYLRDGIIFLNVDNIRDGYHAAVRRPAGDPGSIMFPSGLGLMNNAYFKHLCKRQTVIVDNKSRRKDVQLGPGREDWLDGRVYSRSVILGWLAAIGQEHRVHTEAAAAVLEAQRTISVQSQLQEQAPHSAPPPTIRIPQFMPRLPQYQQRNLIGRNRQWRR